MTLQIPKYMQKLCAENLKTYPAPYEYILYQNKHIPEGRDTMTSKVECIQKFILRHHGEFKIIGKEYISGDKLCLHLFFNCDVIVAKELDKLIV